MLSRHLTLRQSIVSLLLNEITSVSEKLFIITTCSQRKAVKPRSEFLLRHLNSDNNSVSSRARAWSERLASCNSATLRAMDLYAGDHWKVALSVIEMASVGGYHAPGLWICSAGYGLLHKSDHIYSYGATFNTNHQDRVASNQTETKVWWKTLSDCDPIGLKRPRSLTQLVQRSPDATFLIAASVSYLRAMEDDLTEALSSIDDPECLLIVSSGSQQLAGLGDHILPSDARLQTALGGARQSLNIRIARWLVETFPADSNPLRYSTAKEHLEELLTAQPELTQHNRKTMTDDELLQFILNLLSEDPKMSKSRGLRMLRDSNRACEQRRFGALFNQAREQYHG